MKLGRKKFFSYVFILCPLIGWIVDSSFFVMCTPVEAKLIHSFHSFPCASLNNKESSTVAFHSYSKAFENHHLLQRISCWRSKDATWYIYVYSLNVDWFFFFSFFLTLALNSFALSQWIFCLLQKNLWCLLYHRNKLAYFHKERENPKRDCCATIYSYERSVIWLVKNMKLQPCFFSVAGIWSPSGLLMPAA